ncbi:MAG: hypothetical protein VYD19_07105 [Myxococcota bacterium]|nr:hypothetical protein [Myxococcota bacterium]
MDAWRGRRAFAADMCGRWSVLSSCALISLFAWGCEQGEASGGGEATDATPPQAEMGSSAADMAPAPADMGSAVDRLPPDLEPPEDLTVPIIRRVRAYINQQEGGLGLEIAGRDEDNNVEGFTLELLYGDGRKLPLGGPEQSGPVRVVFENLQQGNGDYIGVWSAPFRLGTSLGLEELALAKVTIFDEDGKESEVFEAPLIDPPTVGRGERCDLQRGLSRCEEGLLCGDAAGGRYLCSPATTECPEFFESVDLNGEAAMTNEDGSVSYLGNTRGCDNGSGGLGPCATYGVGSCGGGTATNLFTYTASMAGRYQFVVTPLEREDPPMEGEMRGPPDSLIWLRSHCGFSDWAAELGCNDDIDLPAMNLGSQVSAELEAEQTVYLFVDGYANDAEGIVGWSGPFEVTVYPPSE